MAKERPILFSGAMVRALLAGTKTQTRRVVKPQTIRESHLHEQRPHWIDASTGKVVRCQYGEPGDRLWARETWAYHLDAMAASNHEISGPWVYAADGEMALQRRLCGRWRPSIHMPRAASRILRDVVSVRVERLQDISEADALAEGTHYDSDMEVFSYECGPPCNSARDAYACLWESINGAGTWQANPWVWVVEFKQVNE